MRREAPDPVPVGARRFFAFLVFSAAVIAWATLTDNWAPFPYFVLPGIVLMDPWQALLAHLLCLIEWGAVGLSLSHAVGRIRSAPRAAVLAALLSIPIVPLNTVILMIGLMLLGVPTLLSCH